MLGYGMCKLRIYFWWCGDVCCFVILRHSFICFFLLTKYDCVLEIDEYYLRFCWYTFYLKQTIKQKLEWNCLDIMMDWTMNGRTKYLNKFILLILLRIKLDIWEKREFLKFKNKNKERKMYDNKGDRLHYIAAGGLIEINIFLTCFS